MPTVQLVFFRPAHITTNLFCSVSLADDARRWFESSTIICRFVPDGEARAAKVGLPCMQWLLSFRILLLLARSPTRIPIYLQGSALKAVTQRNLNCPRIPDRTPLLGLLHYLALLLVLFRSAWLCGWLLLPLVLKAEAVHRRMSLAAEPWSYLSCHNCYTLYLSAPACSHSAAFVILRICAFFTCLYHDCGE
jgi:hypothetical protein